MSQTILVTSKKRKRNLEKYTCVITGGKANIQNKKDDWIRVKHLGPNKPWNYPLCESVEPTNAKFNKQLQHKYHIRKCFLYCKC